MGDNIVTLRVVLAVSGALVALGVMVAVGFWLRCRSALETLRDRDGSLRIALLKVEELEAEVLAWKEQAQNEERRRGEVVQTIVSIQKERDGWKDLYLQCALEHGVAQDLMTQEIQHLQGLIRAHGIKNPENKRVRNVSDGFRAKYLDGKPGAKMALGECGGTGSAVEQNPVDLGAVTLAESARG